MPHATKSKPETRTKDEKGRDRPPTIFDPNWTWSNPSSWPLSIRFLPVGVAIIAIGLATYFPSVFGNPYGRLMVDNSCVGTFNYTFQIAAAKRHAENLATHDWEIGTAGQAILELISPQKAVFSANPFPNGKVPYNLIKMDEALLYVFENVRIWSEGETIVSNNYSVSDPASLGVSAVMIGQIWHGWAQAADEQKRYLLEKAPRHANGAISHRVEVAELWSDAVFMFPPFLAYYGVAMGDEGAVREAFRQVGLYRDVLMITDGDRKGLWRHIVGPSETADDGAWSTGNGWAAYGMARVRATLVGWEKGRDMMREEVSTEG